MQCFTIFIGLIISLGLSAQAQAQDRIYRCGNEYTNSVPSPQTKGCVLVEGGNVTVKKEGLDPAAMPVEVIAEMAQKLEGTIYVIPHRESADGDLTACGLEFSAMKRDFSTMKGAPVKIVGSFYIRPNGKVGVAYVLKLGVFDGFGYEVGFAPSNAFVRAPNGITPKKAIRTEAETKGFALFVGAFDKSAFAAFTGIAEKSQLIVGFNRKPGQQDVTFKLDLTVTDSQMSPGGKVVRTKSDQPVREFLDCSADLLKSANVK